MTIEREKFEAWLFSQPDDRTYIYTENRNCLMCKFLNEMTNGTGIMVFTGFFHINGKSYSLPEWFDKCDLSDFHIHLPEFLMENIRSVDETKFKIVKDQYIKMFGNPLIIIENENLTNAGSNIGTLAASK